MIQTKIDSLRKELNSLIESGASFEEIQKVSHLLDNCLIEYYDKKLGKE